MYQHSLCLSVGEAWPLPRKGTHFWAHIHICFLSAANGKNYLHRSPHTPEGSTSSSSIALNIFTTIIKIIQ